MSQMEPKTFGQVDDAIKRVDAAGKNAKSSDVAILREWKNIGGSRANAARAALAKYDD